MRELILRSTLNLFLFSVLWSCWMLFVGAIPHLVTGTSIFSLTFEYRDYLLRVFVVFAVAHLFVRQTNFKLLVSIPLIALALQVGINVYDFSEWYSQTFRVNLHELNAQLFVVPVQLGVLAVSVYFCCRKQLRTTTRIFSTMMLAGSIFSTLGFHLSIVNVTYKPVERIYSSGLKGIAQLEHPEETCSVTGYECLAFSLSKQSWTDDHQLDPQIPIAHNTVFSEAIGSHAWIRRGEGVEHFLGMAKPIKDGIYITEAILDMAWLSPLMNKAFGAGVCQSTTDVSCSALSVARDNPQVSAFSQNVMARLESSDTYIHSWVHTHDLDGDGFVEPVFFAAGKQVGNEARMVVSPLPESLLDGLAGNLANGDCAIGQCQTIKTASELKSGYPASVTELLEASLAGTYKVPSKLWVDKALSRNPVLYINRPEFLRYYAYKDGEVRVLTSPKAFSDTTLDLKLTFNLIIGLFSVSWLTFGVFLILFHTRRQLVKA